jgi:hypothetical protein
MMEALSSSETSVLTRATWGNIPEDAIILLIMNFVKECFKTYDIKSGFYFEYELYRPSSSSLSAKSILTLVDKGVSLGQCNGSPQPLISLLWTGTFTLSFKQLLNYPHEAEWAPFQTHCFSEDRTRDLWICSQDL